MPDNGDTTSTPTETVSEGQEATGTATTPPEGAATGTQEPPAGTQAFSPEYVSTLRQEAAAYRTRLRETEAERDALTSRVSEFETRVPDLETRLTAAEGAALRYTVAAEAGIPLAFASRLKGESLEEITADADAVKALLGSSAPPADLGQGRTGEAVAPKRDVNEAFRALAGR